VEWWTSVAISLEFQVPLGDERGKRIFFDDC
jgi:hypothetical protein